MCKLITGLFRIEVCHGSTFGGGGGIGKAVLELGTCDIAADVLGTCDIAELELGTCDIGGETTAT